MVEGEGNPEANQFEALQHDIFGPFDRAVWSAESVKDYLQADVLSGNLARVEFEWKTVVETHAVGKAELERGRDQIDAETFDSLQRTFNELREHAETIFGRKL